jgi:hypothetical protein
MLQVLHERYREQLSDEIFTLEAPSWEHGVHLRVELANSDRSVVTTLEARAAREEHTALSDEQLVHLCLDMTGHLLDLFLVDDQGALPGLDWKQVFYAGSSVYVRAQSSNEDLVHQANLLLERVAPGMTLNDDP